MAKITLQQKEEISTYEVATFKEVKQIVIDWVMERRGCTFSCGQVHFKEDKRPEFHMLISDEVEKVLVEHMDKVEKVKPSEINYEIIAFDSYADAFRNKI